MEGQPTCLLVGNELEKDEDYQEHLQVVKALFFCVEVEQCEQLLVHQVNTLC